MAALSTIALVASAGVGVAGTLASVSAQRRSAQLQQRQQTLSTQASRRQGIRQAQLARARALNMASAMGGAGGSGILGGVSSLGSQLGTQLGFSTAMSGLSRGINRAQSQAQTWSGLAQLGFTGFQALGGFPALRDVFQGPNMTRQDVRAGVNRQMLPEVV